MFREMRRKDRETTTERAYEILKGSSYGVFTIQGDDGYPYGVPVNHVVVNNDIYFHAATEGKKYDSILQDNNCGFTTVLYNEVIPGSLTTKYASCICMGKAEFLEGEEKYQALIEITKGHASEFMSKGMASIKANFERTSIIKIKIDHITGKENK